LNLAPGGPLDLVEEFPYLDNPIKLDPLLRISLNLCVHYLINGCLFHAVNLFGINCSVISDVSNNGGKYGQRSTLNTGCEPRKGGVLSSKSLLPTT
jgi:hypothetical protein